MSRIFNIGLVISAAGNVVNYLAGARTAANALQTTMANIKVQRGVLETMTRLRGELTTAQATVAQFDIGLARVKQHFDTSTRLATQFAQKIRVAEDAGRGIAVQIKRVKDNIDVANKVTEGFKSNLTLTEQKIGASAVLAQKLRTRLKAADDTTIEATAHMAQLREGIARADRISSNLSQNISKTEHKLQASASQAETLHQRLEAVTNHGRGAKGEIQALEAAIKRTDRVTAGLQSTAEKYRLELGTSTAGATQLREKLLLTETTTAATTAEMVKLRELIVRADAVTAGLEQKAERYRNIITATTTVADRLRVNLQLAERSGANNAAEVTRIKESLQRAERVADQFKNRLVDATRQGETMRREVERTEQALKRAAERAQQLKLNLNGPADADRRLANHQRSLEIGAKGQAMQDRGRDLRGQGYGGLIGVGVAGYAAKRLAMPYLQHEDQITDIGIVGDLNKKDKNTLFQMVRKTAKDENQTTKTVNEGMAGMVAAGMSVKEAQTYVPLLARTATAERVAMPDLSKLIFSLSNNMNIKGPAAMKEALESLAIAGKLGFFEFKDMARYVPMLSAQMKSFGATGIGAVRELGATLQVERTAAGTTEEAATNLHEWMSHMTSAHTGRMYKSVGIDYPAEFAKRMTDGRHAGALQVSRDIAEDFAEKFTAGKTIVVRSHLKGHVKERLSFKEARDRAEKSGDKDAVKNVFERFAMSKLFQEQKTTTSLLAYTQNKPMLASIKAAQAGPEAKGVLERDKAIRMDVGLEKAKSLGIRLHDMAIGIGKAVMTPDGKKPGDVSLTTTANGYLDSVTKMIDGNQAIVANGVKLAAGLALLTVGVMAAKFLAGGAMGIGGGAMRLWGWLRGKKTGHDVQKVYVVNQPGGGSDPLRRLPRTRLSRLGALSRIGAKRAMRSAGGLMRTGLGVLGKIPGVGAIGNVMKVAGPLVFNLARGLLMAMGPIGWTIGAVAALAYGGYKLYKNWDTIGPKLKKVWTGVVGAVSWAWNAYKSYITGFVRAGADIVDGFVGGIGARWQKVKNGVMAMGTDALKSIKSVLGIHSPSRKFMEVGGYVSEGAAIGIARKAHLVKTEATKLAGVMLGAGTPAQGRTVPPWATAAMQGRVIAPAAGGGAPAITIHYAPVIHLGGADPTQLTAALAADKARMQDQFEQLFRRMMADQNRRAFK